jgi:hypothetical protein
VTNTKLNFNHNSTIMKELRQRINALHVLQNEQETKLIQSIEGTIESVSPASLIKSTIGTFFKDKEVTETYPKLALRLLFGNIVDRLISKKSPINEPIKELVAVNLVNVLFNDSPKKDVILKERNHI